MSNSIPFFILLFMLIYFYRRISYQIFFLLYFLSGLSVWLAGREAWHIGASGVVYAMAAFHFVSGIIRNDVRLLTLSVVVVFLYGGLIWGIFPIDPEISWEGHLWGAVSGVVLAIYYRKYTIRRDKFEWEEEEETSNESSQSAGEEGGNGQVQVHFTLKDSANKENPEGQQNVKSGDDGKEKQQHSSLLSEKFPPRSTSHTGNM